jgi:ribosome small subunit-dependent GTPase A
MYNVYWQGGEIRASVSGKMIYTAAGREDYPAVGDWVIIDKPADGQDTVIIRGILKRKSKFSRKNAGNTFDEQIIAANIDIAFICMSLNENFNLRRLERYITMAWDSGANPVVLLTKSDLCGDIDEKLQEVAMTAIGVDTHCVSCLEKQGIEKIKSYLKRGCSAAFLGSSGVGKSSIINELLDEERQLTGEVSSIGNKGRHTTTSRELILIPDGGIVIDTPGMREFHLMDVGDSVDNAFEDIENLSLKCKFSNCTHSAEPGCAVRNAIETGLLDEERYSSYIKLKKEAAFMERKTSRAAESQYKKMMKKRAMEIRKHI